MNRSLLLPVLMALIGTALCTYAQLEQPVRLVMTETVTTTEPTPIFGLNDTAEVEITGTETIEIAAGEYIEVDNFGFASNSTGFSQYVTGRTGILVQVSEDAVPYLAGENDTIVGPATCRLFVTYRHQPADQTSTFTFVANILLSDGTISLDGLQSDQFGRLVIPEDTNGDVDVILEQSSDLINWTNANPGTYSASEEKRFFRIRARIKN